MSHERLEQQIVEALRRAPGPEPGATLDAAILARARAAVATPRRSVRPRWLSLAAGVVVLVGGGLAMRIWQQVEQMPSALDAPTSFSVPAAPPPPATGVQPIEDVKQTADSVGVLRKDDAPEAATMDDRVDSGRLARAAATENAAEPTPPADPAPGAAGSGEPARRQAEAAQTPRGADMRISPPPAQPKAESPAAAASAPVEQVYEAEAKSIATSIESGPIRLEDSAAQPLADAAPAAASPAPKPMPATKPALDAVPAAPPEMTGGVMAAPAPPAEPFPGKRREEAAAERLQQVAPIVGATRDVLQQAADVQQRIARIRELLAAQQNDLALAEWQSLERDYPDSQLPPDLQSALERLERKP